MKIHHYFDPQTLIVKIAFESSPTARFHNVYNFATKKIHTIEYGDQIPSECFMEMPKDVFEEMLKGFAEIANKKGIKLDSDLKREGQLEATKFHLDDLRILLKLKK